MGATLRRAAFAAVGILLLGALLAALAVFWAVALAAAVVLFAYALLRRRFPRRPSEAPPPPGVMDAEVVGGDLPGPPDESR